jgi:hypothetical protein
VLAPWNCGEIFGVVVEWVIIDMMNLMPLWNAAMHSRIDHPV